MPHNLIQPRLDVQSLTSVLLRSMCSVDEIYRKMIHLWFSSFFFFASISIYLYLWTFLCFMTQFCTIKSAHRSLNARPHRDKHAEWMLRSLVYSFLFTKISRFLSSDLLLQRSAPCRAVTSLPSIAVYCCQVGMLSLSFVFFLFLSIASFVFSDTQT